MAITVKTLSVKGTAKSELIDNHTLTNNLNITALAGDDTLLAGVGNDTLDGGTGNDSMAGGAGNDTYLLDNAGDKVTELADGGNDTIMIGYQNTDTVATEINLANFTNVENITISGTGLFNLTGNNANNLLTGNASANFLVGNFGNDTLIGGAGDDILYGDDGQNLGTYNDFLDGGTGNDNMIGGRGDDTYIVDSAGDRVFERGQYFNEGIDTVKTTLATLDLGTLQYLSAGNGYAAIDNLIYIGTSTFNGSANSLDNFIQGGGKNDTIFGAGGNDTIDGGAGADVMNGGSSYGVNSNNTYYVDNVGDTVVEFSGQGNDTIIASINYSLVDTDGKSAGENGNNGGNVENLTLLEGSKAVNGTGNDLNNRIIGNSAANLLDGGVGSDYLEGGAGNDTLIGGLGGDNIQGGAGNDVYIITSGAEKDSAEIQDNAGVNEVRFTSTTENDTLLLRVEESGINRVVLGTGTGAVAITTGKQALNVNSSSYTDDLTVIGNDGANNLSTGLGSDTILSGAGNDIISTNLGNDSIDGGAGNDSMAGGNGNDTYIVDSTSDMVTELDGQGTDTVLTSLASVTLANGVENLTYTGKAKFTGIGNDGDNALTGGASTDSLTGNSGNDTLDGGAGADTLTGGAGQDIYYVDNTGDVIQEDSDFDAGGIDTVYASVNYSLADTDGKGSLGNGVENLILTSKSAIFATGNDGNNQILVISNLNTNNFIEGGAGNDSMDGGDGSDVYIYNHATDKTEAEVSDSGTVGTDEIRFNDTVDGATLYINSQDEGIERMVIGTGTGAAAISTGKANLNINAQEYTSSINLVGNSGNNQLLGGLGNDTLDGGAGNDALNGGVGDDTYIVNSTGTTINEGEGNGVDTIITSLTSYSIANTDLDNITFSGKVKFTGTGNILDNKIIGGSAGDSLLGDAGNDSLDGGAGADSLVGGDGNDTYVIDNAGDKITETADAGIDTVSTSLASFDLSSATANGGSNINIENLTYTGTAKFTGVGNGSDNYITGGTSTDSLSGGLGNDTLSGGAGIDTLIGGAGNDSYVIDSLNDKVVETAGNGTDTLVLNGAGLNLDITKAAVGQFTNIEMIDLSGSGNNSITLNTATISAMSESKTLYVKGNAGDLVNTSDKSAWVMGNTIDFDSQTYQQYTSGSVTLNIALNITKEITPPSNFELSNLNGKNGFYIDGLAAAERIGSSIHMLGDINGDGLDDFIIGAPAYSAGKAYVVFGRSSTTSNSLDLTKLDGKNGFVINGFSNMRAGTAVSDAGDVNGDGIDDLMISAPKAAANGQLDAGITYVVFGKKGAFDSKIDLSNFNASNGFQISGVSSSVTPGGYSNSISSAGDINGDGYDDVIIGAPRESLNTGAAYVVFGKAGAIDTNINFDALNGANGFKITGATKGDAIGVSVSSAGDINHDGFDDIVIGAPSANSNGTSYIVFGKASGFDANFNLSNLDGSNGFKLVGVSNNEKLGIAVSGIGDVNGDGIDDLVLGASNESSKDPYKGKSYVVFGKNGEFTSSFDLSTLDGSNGFSISGAGNFDESGSAVSKAGDVNGDGFEDVIISSTKAYANDSRTGASYLVYGKAGGFDADIDLGKLGGKNGFKISGVNYQDYSGYAVSGGGDLNGDGFDDLIVSATGADPNGNSSGKVYVIYGSDTGSLFTQTGSASADTITGSTGVDKISSGNGNDLIIADAGNDFVKAAAGRDTIDGGAGNDTIDGGEGSDIYVVAKGSDKTQAEINDSGATGNDEVRFTSTTAGDTLKLFANDRGIESVVIGSGTGAIAVVTGKTALNVDASGVTTALKITGNAGNNNIKGGLGNDSIDGGLGNDTLAGGKGDDTYYVESATDSILEIAGQGKDTIITALASYTLANEVENLIYSGKAAFKGTGNDVNNLITGGVAGDSLVGANGDDTLNGGAGNDSLVGGAGNDTYIIESTNDKITELASSGIDTVITSFASFDLSSATTNGNSNLNIENVTYQGSSNFTATGNALNNILIADTGNDTLDGGTGNDNLSGASGNDSLSGGNGNDTLNGGNGDDTLVGGSGNDTYVVNSNNDVVTEAENNGIDTIITSLNTYDLSNTTTNGSSNSNIENLSYIGSNDFTGIGNNSANILSGGAGNDSLKGFDGNDTLIGNAGNDIYVFDANDSVIEQANQGTDTLVINQSADLNSLTTGQTISNIEFIDITGTGNNTLTLSKATIDAISESKTITVKGNIGDVIVLTDVDGWLPVKAVMIDGLSYNQFSNNGTTLNIGADVSGQGLPIANYSLNTLTGTNGFTLAATQAMEYSGQSVSNAGDVNGDGFDDVIVGGRYGSSYVVFGKADGFASSTTLNPQTLTGSNGFVIKESLNSNKANYAGGAISGAGDVNGDGYADLIVGAKLTDVNSLIDNGASYVIFGGQSLGSNGAVFLNSLNGSTGFKLSGVAQSDFSGKSVSNAGDLNGDGFDDVFIGAPAAGSSAGAGYVVFGKSTGFASNINLSALNGTNGFKLTGVSSFNQDNTGSSVSNAGDINGDGFDDIIIGAYIASPSGQRFSEYGAAYVVFGKAGGFGDGAGNLNLSSLDGSNGFKLSGANYYDRTGFSVSSAGDINGDGFADVIVNANNPRAGKYGGAYVLYGKANGFAGDINLANMNGTNGFNIKGASRYDEAGVSVSSAGDMNGDGFSDFLVSSAVTSGFAGATYVVFGKTESFGASLKLSDINGINGFKLSGAVGGDLSGRSVSDAGDVNGDGFDDIIIGAPNSDNLAFNGGASYVVFGQDYAKQFTQTGTSGDDAISGTALVDKVVSGAGNDAISTLEGDDLIRAGAGNDTLNGGTGNDTLVGGNGHDVFVFDSSLDGLTNVDEISDFAHGVDKLNLSASVFSSLVAGGLAPASFSSGTGDFTPADANDFIYYNTNTGDLFYDADGNGAGVGVKFSTLSAHLSLDANDFLIIA